MTPTKHTRLVERLREINGAVGLIVEPAEMEAYLWDWRHRERGDACAVALPASTEAVAQTVRACHDLGVGVFPQGGNTGLCLGAVPSGGGVVLSLARLKQIREIDRASSALIVEAGAPLAQVHCAAEQFGRAFPLHLGSEGTAQIGGLISTNAGGTGALRYGTMRDLVLGLEVVLADGEIWNGLSVLRKDNTGYDLKHLFIGAEGSLGIITAAALKLVPALQTRADAWLALDTPEQAIELLMRFQDNFDTDLQAFELISHNQIAAVLAHIDGRRCPFTPVPPWSVMVELGAADPTAPLAARLEDVLAGALELGLVKDAVIAQSIADANAFWELRHSVSDANKRAGHGVTLDICVPVSKAAVFIADADALCAARFPDAQPIVVCHLGDGNVHYIPMFAHDWWAAQDDATAVTNSVLQAFHDLAAAHGGSYSAEHGIGRKLRGELGRLTAARELDIFHKLKGALDPHGLMNPGVLFEEDRR
jgi:FAD/FMN-containing dehydrogenase